VNNIILITSAVLYFAATFLFLSFSYSDGFDDFFRKLKAIDSTNISFSENYFMGNVFLPSFWIFFFATGLLVLCPIIEFISGRIDRISFVIAVSVISFFLLYIFLWIRAFFVENLLLNGGKGSSFAYDFISCCDCCGCLKPFVSPDILAGSVIFCLSSVMLIILSILALIFVHPLTVTLILEIVSVFFLMLGAVAMTLYLSSIPTILQEDENKALNQNAWDDFYGNYYGSNSVVDEERKKVPNNDVIETNVCDNHDSRTPEAVAVSCKRCVVS